MNKLFYLHPFIFALAIILSIFSHNKGQLLAGNIVVPLFLVLIETAAVFFIFFLISKNWSKAALLTSLALFFFFFYGQLYSFFDSRVIFGTLVGRARYFFPLWTFLFLFFAYIILRVQYHLETATKSMLIAVAVFIAFPLFDIAIFEFKNRDDDGVSSNEVTAAAPLNMERKMLPDIYYIILDGYARGDTLNTLFGYDNGEFVNRLRQLGFFVHDESRSNYARTFLSLSSSLNMRYLDDFTALEDEDVQFRTTYRLIRDNDVIRFLQDRGYQIIHFRSGWDQTEYSPFADVNISCGTLNEFLTLLIRMTPLDILDKKFHFTGDDVRARTLCTFSRLAKIADAGGEQKFIFAHILQPHAPYVFGPNGEVIENDSVVSFGDGYDDKNLYVGQLHHLNKLVLNAVEAMLERSRRPLIVILQSDHGTASLAGPDGEKPEDLTNDFFKERMRNFMAVYIPPSGPQLDRFETPVNLFRSIFNAYFDSDYPLLEERSLYSPPYSSFTFFDVTDAIAVDPNDPIENGK